MVKEVTLIENSSRSSGRKMNSIAYDELSKLIYRCILGLRAISELNTSDLIYKVFEEVKEPLTTKEILSFINIMTDISKADVEQVLSTVSLFKQVGYHIWALSEWGKYREVIANFNRFLDYAKNNMEDREWDCFISYTLGNEGETYDSISKRYGITRERVRQLINKVVDKLQHNTYKKHINFYIKLLQEQLLYSDYILIDGHNYSKEYKELIDNSDIIQIVTFLNIFKGDFCIFKNKYLCSNRKIEFISKLLDNYCFNLCEFEVRELNVDEILKNNYLKHLLDKELLIEGIKQDKRYLLSEDQNIVFYKKSDIESFSVMYFIAYKLNGPFDYNKLEHEYSKIMGRGLSKDYVMRKIKMDDRFIKLSGNMYCLSTSQNIEDLRNSQSHLSSNDVNKNGIKRNIVDDVVNILLERDRAMHYFDIYELIKDRTKASKKYLCFLLNRDNRIEKMLAGYYKIKHK